MVIYLFTHHSFQRMKNNPTRSIGTKAVRWHQKAAFWQIALCCVVGLATSAQASHRPVSSTAHSNQKVLICHKGHDLYISSNAVPAHLSQHPGDRIGSCNGGGGGQEGRTATTSAQQSAVTVLR